MRVLRSGLMPPINHVQRTDGDGRDVYVGRKVGLTPVRIERGLVVQEGVEWPHKRTGGPKEPKVAINTSFTANLLAWSENRL